MLERVILGLLYLYCASMALSEPIANFAVDVAMLLSLIHMVRRRDFNVGDKTLYFLSGLYLLMLAISALGAYDPKLSLRPIWVSFYYTLIPYFLAYRYIDNESKRWTALGWMTFSVTLTAIHTLWTASQGWTRPQGFLYLLETGGHIDMLGIIIFMLILLHFNQPGWFRKAAGPILALFVLALLVTLSRQAWIVATVVTFLGVVFAKMPWRKLVALVVALVIVAVLGFGIAVMLKPELSDRTYLAEKSARGVGERFTMWQEAWKKFADHPVTGIGPGNSPVVDHRYVLPQRIDQSPLTHPHSVWFQLLSETGIAGTIAYVLLYGYLLLHLLQKWKTTRSVWVAGVFLAMLSLQLNGLTENFVFGVLPVVQSGWFLLGMAWRVPGEKERTGFVKVTDGLGR